MSAVIMQVVEFLAPMLIFIGPAIINLYPHKLYQKIMKFVMAVLLLALTGYEVSKGETTKEIDLRMQLLWKGIAVFLAFREIFSK